ncbi:MAG: methylmalonyl Co-A mutase-associated GTPase MeaB [SAR324 cluster bacterium]|nr:methylmalonyl Co-A mutase-associated GTPase MeaB [SAR324 cluster bacterium]
MKFSTRQFVEEIKKGNRRYMAKAITLLESTLSEHFEQGRQILSELMPDTGNSIRIGITGVPGVGKSTFIEALGLSLIHSGHQVAVLPVDPSSPISGGSIMGDKTRMTHLSSHPKAFIRPSPSGGKLGGVARKTKEIIMICESAKYDVIFVETVGVGQSETLVASMVDCFLVLMLPNAGDELQGIKKGILEIADLIVINKADGENLKSAENAAQQYSRALEFHRPLKTSWTPKILTCSALENRGLEELWKIIIEYKEKTQASGEWDRQRHTQNNSWMKELIEEELLNRFRQDPNVQELILSLEQSVREGIQDPISATRNLLDLWFASMKEAPH